MRSKKFYLTKKTFKTFENFSDFGTANKKFRVFYKFLWMGFMTCVKKRNVQKNYNEKNCN